MAVTAERPVLINHTERQEREPDVDTAREIGHKATHLAALYDFLTPAPAEIVKPKDEATAANRRTHQRLAKFMEDNTMNFDVLDVDGLVQVILETRPVKRKGAAALDYQNILMQYFEGRSVADIARDNETSAQSINHSVGQLFREVKQKWEKGERRAELAPKKQREIGHSASRAIALTPAHHTVPAIPDGWFVDPVRIAPGGEQPKDDPNEKLAWQKDSLCAQIGSEVFFPEKGGSTRDAKKICASCEVREMCLQYALDNDERFGIWGGLSERERRKLRKRA